MRKSAIAPERGVYMWEGVGRGKTWLMDMFPIKAYPQNENCVCTFHRFMLRVQDELKGLQGQENPLDIIASTAFKAQTDVLCFDEFFCFRYY